MKTTSMAMASKALNTIKHATGYYDLKSRAIENLTEKQIKKIKSYFGVEFKLRNNDAFPVIQWLSKHDAKFASHIDNPQVLDTPDGLMKSVLEQISISNTDFIVKLDKATYAFVSTYDQMHKYKHMYSTYVDNRGNDNSSEHKSASIGDMTIYIFGKKMNTYVAEFKSCVSISTTALCQYVVMGGEQKGNYTIIAKELNPRPIDSLFFDTNVKEQVTTHIDTWLRNEPIYAERSLNFKTGILLKGEPGTGKTSLVTALAAKYKMEIVNVNMPSFKNIDIDRVVDSINADNEKYIILLEEIDTVFGAANREDANIDKDDKKLISDLLQFIDSGKSPNNVIFIATTNYPEKLDKALVRKGRFDIIVSVESIKTEKTVIEMCKSFDLEQYQIDTILDTITLPIDQAALQYMILNSIKRESGAIMYDDIVESDDLDIVESDDDAKYEDVKNLRASVLKLERVTESSLKENCMEPNIDDTKPKKISKAKKIVKLDSKE